VIIGILKKEGGKKVSAHTLVHLLATEKVSVAPADVSVLISRDKRTALDQLIVF
jgi:hypothetical protein